MTTSIQLPNSLPVSSSTNSAESSVTRQMASGTIQSNRSTLSPSAFNATIRRRSCCEVIGDIFCSILAFIKRILCFFFGGSNEASGTQASTESPSLATGSSTQVSSESSSSASVSSAQVSTESSSLATESGMQTDGESSSSSSASTSAIDETTNWESLTREQRMRWVENQIQEIHGLEALHFPEDLDPYELINAPGSPLFGLTNQEAWEERQDDWMDAIDDWIVPALDTVLDEQMGSAFNYNFEQIRERINANVSFANYLHFVQNDGYADFQLPQVENFIWDILTDIANLSN